MTAELLKRAGIKFKRDDRIPKTREELQESNSELEERIESLTSQIAHLTKSFKKLERCYNKALKNDTHQEFRATFKKESIGWRIKINNLQVALEGLVADREQFQQENPDFRRMTNAKN